MFAEGFGSATGKVRDWAEKYHPEIIQDALNFCSIYSEESGTNKNYGVIKFLAKYTSYDDTGSLIFTKVNTHKVPEPKAIVNYIKVDRKTPTQLGEYLGKNAHEINLALETIGYQIWDGTMWVATAKGEAYSSYHPTKKLSRPKPWKNVSSKDPSKVAQGFSLYWIPQDILPILKDHFKNELF